MQNLQCINIAEDYIHTNNGNINYVGQQNHSADIAAVKADTEQNRNELTIIIE